MRRLKSAQTQDVLFQGRGQAAESASADLAVHGIGFLSAAAGQIPRLRTQDCEYCRPFLCAPARDGISLGGLFLVL
jgi:hypothetical protein